MALYDFIGTMGCTAMAYGPTPPPNMLCSPIVQQHSKRFLHGGTDGTLDGNGVPEHPGKPM